MVQKRYRNVVINDDELLEGESSYDGVRWGTFTARQDLAWIELAITASSHRQEALQRIWDRQDGYGEPGDTPPQGFDWSGIRDSSPEAILDMLAIAQEYVTYRDLLAFYGLPEEVPG